MGMNASKLSQGFRSLKRLKSGRSSPLVVTPRGFVPVAVGMDQEMKRFMVHRTALSSAEFVQRFLQRSAEEYGFCNEGILRIPCDAKVFEQWMMATSARQKVFRTT